MHAQWGLQQLSCELGVEDGWGKTDLYTKVSWGGIKAVGGGGQLNNGGRGGKKAGVGADWGGRVFGTRLFQKLHAQ